MYNINTKAVIVNLKGEAIKTEDGLMTIGEAIANILLNSKTGGKMKMFVLAQKFFDEKKISIDSSDMAMIKRATEETETYSNLVSGQVLVALEALKEEKEEKPAKTK